MKVTRETRAAASACNKQTKTCLHDTGATGCKRCHPYFHDYSPGPKPGSLDQGDGASSAEEDDDDVALNLACPRIACAIDAEGDLPGGAGDHLKSAEIIISADVVDADAHVEQGRISWGRRVQQDVLQAAAVLEQDDR